jgi:hypothetical protein
MLCPVSLVPPCCRAGPQSEGSTLLLYTLLHGSKSFQEYVLVRSDPETLLMPLLQQLYKANKRRANHLYMLQVREQDGMVLHHQHAYPCAVGYSAAHAWCCRKQ